jgi:hypothetical protein
MTLDLPDPPARRFRLASTIGLFALGFAVLAWPWLSGSVTIPWDAKSNSFPNLAFLARSLAFGQSPFWTPNVYAGWPQIADPQALIFSPLHFALAWFNATPSFRAADAVVFALLFVGGLGVILIFRERGWHEGGAVVAALAFAFGGSNASRIQHIGLLESACWLPLALFLLMRAVERASWRWGAAAGLAAGLVAIGRDQVALLGLYVLAGFVLWHWLDGEGVRARITASFKPLAAGAFVGAIVVALPILLTVVLASSSNRPEIGYEIASRGSLHPADLLMLVFADLFGAADPNIPYWGPPSFPWHGAFGSTDLYHAQNIGQLYAGALVIVAVIGLGIVRGVLWSREVRFFTVALALLLLYALGKYTPAFRAMYEVLPGVALYRRPADATFPLGLMLAICAGYCVHRWLMDAVPRSTWWQRCAEVALVLLLLGAAAALAVKIGTEIQAINPIIIATVIGLAAVGVLRLSYRLAAGNAAAAAAVLAAFSTADLAFNNAPNESTGLPPSFYDALRPDTQNETVALLKSRLASAAAPDRRDRVELVGIGYHWPNLGLVHDFDHLFGHNPLRLADFARATNVADTVAVPDQRRFSPLLPSYNSPLENLFGVRFIATGVPIEQIDPSLKPGDVPQIARTKDAYIYENPRALPRVMLAGDWRHADFDEMLRAGHWPEVDLRRTVLLQRRPESFIPGTQGGSARIVSYRNTEVVVETDAPAPSLLVLNDIWHPWWRACVDRSEVEIMKANVLFRAVVVPAGKHHVRFSFHPFAGVLGSLWPRSSSGSRC